MVSEVNPGQEPPKKPVRDPLDPGIDAIVIQPYDGRIFDRLCNRFDRDSLSARNTSFVVTKDGVAIYEGAYRADFLPWEGLEVID